MYRVARSALFRLDAEVSHDLSMWFLQRSQRNGLRMLYAQKTPLKPVSVLGLTFPNPLGLAAGLDKNGECIDAFAAMGFGFIEVGTVTPRAQAGNPKPRLFRLPAAQAVINRMGFNNKGVDYLVEQIQQSEYSGILGINIGKNKTTPEQQALDDYVLCLKKVYQYADYVVINISSPNTPGLRNLQYGTALETLLAGLQQTQTALAQQYGKKVPLLVKIAPDLTPAEVQAIADSLRKLQVDGVIATNTTIQRPGVDGLRHSCEKGGLSGAPLQPQSLAITAQLATALAGEVPIIAVGGVDSASAARARLDGGASLVQVYSALLYRGPTLVADIVNQL